MRNDADGFEASIKAFINRGFSKAYIESFMWAKWSWKYSISKIKDTINELNLKS